MPHSGSGLPSTQHVSSTHDDEMTGWRKYACCLCTFWKSRRAWPEATISARTSLDLRKGQATGAPLLRQGSGTD
ncbi:MAG: hypothetical protein V3V61_00955 [Gammaproteobacteria bacterium]